ncbi:hypothetical protein PG996_005253 [Apiospora saccharicola]|uniref:Uncharacterized protein n=1 Tax=Apiospora saccharicola TaxID=335842 RepID=A0ABR1VKY5_9PEZI
MIPATGPDAAGSAPTSNVCNLYSTAYNQAGDNADSAIKQTRKTADGVRTKSADEPRSMTDTTLYKDNDKVKDSNKKLPMRDEVEMVPAAGRINEKGEVIDDDGNAIGRVTDGNAKDFEAADKATKLAQEKTEGQEDGRSKEGGVLDVVLGDVGKAVGIPEGAVDMADEAVKGAEDQAEELGQKAPIEAPIEVPELVPSVTVKIVDMFEGPFAVSDNGQVKDQNSNILGKLAESQDLIGKEIKAINKKGNPLDRVKFGDLEKMIGKKPDTQMCDTTGAIRTEGGNIIGCAELIPKTGRDSMKERPFTKLSCCAVNEPITP